MKLTVEFVIDGVGQGPIETSLAEMRAVTKRLRQEARKRQPAANGRRAKSRAPAKPRQRRERAT